jgi:hypothetical protein
MLEKKKEKSALMKVRECTSIPLSEWISALNGSF